MQPIPTETVDRAWQELAQMEPAKGDEIMQRMIREQSSIVSYLLAVGEKEGLSQDEREVLLYIGTAVWHIFMKGGVSLHPATEKLVLQVESELAGKLNGLIEAPPEQLQAVAQELVAGSAQPEVLRYVVETTLAEDDDAEIRDEWRGIIFLTLATEVEAFCRLAK